MGHRPHTLGGKARGKTSRGTHEERIRWVKDEWRKDPAISLNGRNGMHARCLAKFGVAPRDEQLMEAHAEVERDRRRERERAAILKRERERTPLLQPEAVDRVLRVVRNEPEPQPEPQPDAMERQADEPKKKRKYYSQRERERLYAEIRNRPEGEDLEAACARLGVKTTTFYTWVQRMGVKPRAGVGYSKSTVGRARTRVKIYEYRQATGEPYNGIADRFNIPSGTAHRYGTNRPKYIEAKRILAEVDGTDQKPVAERGAFQPKQEDLVEPSGQSEAIATTVEEKTANEPDWTVLRPPPPPNPVAPQDAADTITAAIKMLLDEVPGLGWLEFKAMPGEQPSLQFHVTVAGKVTL